MPEFMSQFFWTCPLGFSHGITLSVLWEMCQESETSCQVLIGVFTIVILHSDQTKTVLKGKIIRWPDFIVMCVSSFLWVCSWMVNCEWINVHIVVYLPAPTRGGGSGGGGP